MIRFEYLEPASLSDAVAILSRLGAEARVLAGGTDLLARLKERAIEPRYVVNIKRIPGLERITYTPGKGLRIGALTVIRDLEASPLLKGKYTALAQAAHMLGSPEVRNLATIGGNLSNAAPSAETAPSLLSFSAAVSITGPKGERTLPLDSFFSGPGKTVLQEGELLTDLFLPEPLPGTASVYIKLCPRGSMDLAVVGVAVTVAISSQDDKIEQCRIGLGSVAATPMRAREAEALLRGEKPTKAFVKEVARKAAAEVSPITDIRGSAEYRRQMVKAITARAVLQAVEKAQITGSVGT